MPVATLRFITLMAKEKMQGKYFLTLVRCLLTTEVLSTLRFKDVKTYRAT
jgi:hypothetical protein